MSSPKETGHVRSHWATIMTFWPSTGSSARPVFRVLTNAYKESIGATRTTVSSTIQDGFVRIRFWDDGPVLFPPDIYEPVNKDVLLDEPSLEKRRQGSSHRGLRFVQYYVNDLHERCGDLPRFRVATSEVPKCDQYKAMYLDFPLVDFKES